MLNIKSIVKNPEKKFYVDVMFENDLNVYTRRTYKEKEFDGRISCELEIQGLVYTRYADDITFSSNESKIGYKKFISTISQLLSRYGFEVNCKKTKIYTRKGKFIPKKGLSEGESAEHKRDNKLRES